MEIEKMLEHKGHAITVVTYGRGEVIHNVALECNDCSEVLWDEDLDDE